jgi:hypothetical protein
MGKEITMTEANRAFNDMLRAADTAPVYITKRGERAYKVEAVGEGKGDTAAEAAHTMRGTLAIAVNSLPDIRHGEFPLKGGVYREDLHRAHIKATGDYVEITDIRGEYIEGLSDVEITGVMNTYDKQDVTITEHGGAVNVAVSGAPLATATLSSEGGADEESFLREALAGEAWSGKTWFIYPTTAYAEQLDSRVKELEAQRAGLMADLAV